MEQDVDTSYRTLCCTCLSTDRNVISINGLTNIYQVFRLLMYDYAGDRYGDSIIELDQLVCWECLAIMKKFSRFKRQVHNAQEHLRVLAMSQAQETMDHTYMSQSLSSLESVVKTNFDRVVVDCRSEKTTEWPQHYITISTTPNVKNEGYDVAQALRDHISLGIEDHVMGVPEIVLENPVSGVMSHIVVDASSLASATETYTEQSVKGEMPELTLDSTAIGETVIITQTPKPESKPDLKCGYITEYMTEADMMAAREERKKKVHYMSLVYKCELCIVGFYTQQQVEDHFLTLHREKVGHSPCRICYVYIADDKLTGHTDSHYIRRVCKMCNHIEYSVQLIAQHVREHLSKPKPNSLIQIDDRPERQKKRKKKSKIKEEPESPPKPGDLRKLLSKTTIVGYKCLECEMFFKTSRARKNHVARVHREGLQCDHCKKRFVNRTTLATHLRLHEGPLPREECPVCHKMVRSIQIKYHIQRHQNSTRYECKECNKTFSHLATYQAHLKYSRPHASDQIFKYPCPMCNKGYPTKQTMQDHFNYQHLGKTTHKCPVCSKPIATRANVEKHMMRVHGEKKSKPRNHVCQQCGKAFTDKKALTQHEVIHSGERPLSCDVCQQTFKQKASLYTHRKRVHKVFPAKRHVEFMERTE
ncbi:zinc finger protein 82-like [Maniola hyperantus]|uniref:zinc finger protein 82-like n=1 Tax=Aphantopus hyperantus TaxID=2795564 RepID=UPI001568148D|nr:zinc finger protein 26-like isoform X1 [Maniola hyperantus]